MVKQEVTSHPPEIKLDPLPEPIFHGTFESYRKMRVTSSGMQDISLRIKKVIFTLLKSREELWNERSRHNDTEKWESLGFEVFRRTGNKIGGELLKKIFKDTVNSMRNRIIKMKRKKYSIEAVEAYLMKWDLFNYIRYYYDIKLKKRFFEDEDDDELTFLGCFEGSEESSEGTSSAHVENSRESHPEEDAQISNALPTNFEGHFDDQSVSQPQSGKEESNIQNHRNDSHVEVEFIGLQAKRVFERHPQNRPLFLQAMLATFLEFEKDCSGYQSLGELFSAMAIKHS